ncbi:MAG: hypothetical protein WBD07_07030 [Vicinamibacterales bacterium]
MDARHAVTVSAVLALIGAVTSGPLGIWLVGATHPQPAWRDAATFVAAYHPIQTLPYVFGLLLVGGFVGLVASLHALAPQEIRPRTVCAVALAGAFAAMIFVNYAVQTTFVPALVTTSSPENAALISALTMANPRSLGWALEMWGYAVLGAATWLVAPVFRHGPLERTTAWLFVANGPLSVLGGIATAAAPGWVLTPGGLLAFAVWNVLVAAMAALAILSMRARRLGPGRD